MRTVVGLQCRGGGSPPSNRCFRRDRDSAYACASVREGSVPRALGIAPSVEDDRRPRVMARAVGDDPAGEGGSGTGGQIRTHGGHPGHGRAGKKASRDPREQTGAVPFRDPGGDVGQRNQIAQGTGRRAGSRGLHRHRAARRTETRGRPDQKTLSKKVPGRSPWTDGLSSRPPFGFPFTARLRAPAGGDLVPLLILD